MPTFAARPRLVPAPSVEPPFDTAPDWLPAPRRHQPLQLAFDLPDTMPMLPLPRCAALPSARPEPLDRDPRRWSATFAQALLETLTGARPVAQLATWTTRPVHGLIERRAALAAARGRQEPGGHNARLGQLHLCRPSALVVEVAAAIHWADHARALAFRLESRGGRWVCTALELG
jgi:hypothetical protein